MLHALIDLFRKGDVAVLTGAGISTESGIPDYRGPGTLKRARSPMRFADYMATPENRARYWARSMVGWQRFSRAAPNAGHLALAELQQENRLVGLITQNVDRLHQRAGHRDVIELHGALAETRCLECDAIEERASLQQRLVRENPALHARQDELLPDGDAQLPDEALRAFVVPKCLKCDGVLKPNVVFFGENVPKQRVEDGYATIEGARSLVVVGSSLAVFSGLRFVRRAHEKGIAIAILNQGETRGDAVAKFKLEESAGATLQAVVAELAG